MKIKPGKIGKLVAEKRWTMEQLAGEAGICMAYLWFILGHNRCSQEVLKSVAKALDVNPEEIIDTEVVQ